MLKINLYISNTVKEQRKENIRNMIKVGNNQKILKLENYVKKLNKFLKI